MRHDRVAEYALCSAPLPRCNLECVQLWRGVPGCHWCGYHVVFRYLIKIVEEMEGRFVKSED